MCVRIVSQLFHCDKYGPWVDDANRPGMDYLCHNEHHCNSQPDCLAILSSYTLTCQENCGRYASLLCIRTFRISSIELLNWYWGAKLENLDFCRAALARKASKHACTDKQESWGAWGKLRDWSGPNSIHLAGARLTNRFGNGVIQFH